MSQNKERRPTIYVGETEITRDKRSYVIAGGINSLGKFVKIEERVGVRKNFIFVSIEDVKEFCGEIVKASEAIEKYEGEVES